MHLGHMLWAPARHSQRHFPIAAIGQADGRPRATRAVGLFWPSQMAELRHYRYFLEIARQGTFTAAAESLHMAQSALSEQILQLERECGCLLFHRTRSGVKLTPAGEYLIPHAESLLQKAAEMQDGLAGFDLGYQDRVRIGSILGPLQSWLPAALTQFAQTQPHVQISIAHTYHVAEILALVANRQLDVGIVTKGASRLSRARDEGLTETLLADEDLVVLMPAGHPLAHHDVISPEDIRDVRLVTFPTGFTLRWIIDQWYRKAGYSPIVAAETGSIDVVLQLVAGGVGLGIVPRSLSWRGLAAGLRGIAFGPDEPLRRRVVAVRRTDDPRSELVRTLVSLMEVHAQNARRLAALSLAETAGELSPEG